MASGKRRKFAVAIGNGERQAPACRCAAAEWWRGLTGRLAPAARHKAANRHEELRRQADYGEW
jgi:hypothetical protein